MIKKINEKTSNKDLYEQMDQAYNILEIVRIFKKVGTAILQLIYQNLLVFNEVKDRNEVTIDKKMLLIMP